MSLLDRNAPALVVEFGRWRVLALQLRVHRTSVEIVKQVELAMDAETLAADPEAAGRKLRAALDAASITAGPAIIALPRDVVIVKRLELPGAERDELPDMVRFAMGRELPIDAGDAAIDFAPLADSSTVLAVAVPKRLLEPAASALRAAGCRPVAATLRMVGAMALAKGSTSTTEAALAIVDATGEGLEFSVVAGGDVLFSRGVELTRPAVAVDESTGDEATPAPVHPSTDATIAEARRSAFAFRMAHPEVTLGRVVLFAPRLGGEAIRAALATAMGSEVEWILEAPELVDLLDRADSSDGSRQVDHVDHAGRTGQTHPSGQAEPAVRRRGSALPLGGIALASRRAVPILDLLHPRRAPDLAARRRRFTIAGTGLLLIAIFGGFTLGRREAQRVERFRTELREKAQHFASEGRRIRRNEDKLRHIEQWLVPEQDWIEDFLQINAQLPSRGDVVIDTVAATMNPRGVGWKNGQGWTSAADVRITLDGEAKSRAIADALRTRLNDQGRFVVTTPGSDARGGIRLPYPFGYALERSRTADEVSAREAAKALLADGGAS